MRKPLLVVAVVLVSWFATQASRGANQPTTRPHVQKIGVDQFDKMREEKNTVILDVRTPDEFKKGHVPGALNINVDDPSFDKRVSELDKSKTYLVHCASGVRSARAARKLALMGFDRLYDFSPGFRGWKEAGKPIEK